MANSKNTSEINDLLNRLERASREHQSTWESLAKLEAEQDHPDYFGWKVSTVAYDDKLELALEDIRNLRKKILLYVKEDD